MNMQQKKHRSEYLMSIDISTVNISTAYRYTEYHVWKIYILNSAFEELLEVLLLGLFRQVAHADLCALRQPLGRRRGIWQAARCNLIEL